MELLKKKQPIWLHLDREKLNDDFFLRVLQNDTALFKHECPYGSVTRAALKSITVVHARNMNLRLFGEFRFHAKTHGNDNTRI